MATRAPTGTATAQTAPARAARAAATARKAATATTAAASGWPAQGATQPPEKTAATAGRRARRECSSPSPATARHDRRSRRSCDGEGRRWWPSTSELGATTTTSPTARCRRRCCAGCARDFSTPFIAAPTCASFSVAHVPQLRSRAEPEGVHPIPARWRRYVAKHNALATFTVDLIETAQAAGAAWMVENPADCGDRSGAAWWPRFDEHAPLWLLPRERAALEKTRAGLVTFAQCALGAPARKFYTVAFSPSMRAHVSALEAASCTHGEGGHQQVAHGRDEAGRARAPAAAACPPHMNVVLAEALLAAMAPQRVPRRTRDTRGRATSRRRGNGGWREDRGRAAPVGVHTRARGRGADDPPT
eukprot:5145205-Pleurochrysis_carterae.AAC.1